MKYSIIIPFYNSYDKMENLLYSLDNQTYDDFEAIFIDDCSTDDSFIKLSKDLKNRKFNYKLIQNKKNSGPGYSRNNGISNSNGKYILFVDSDDWIENNTLSEIDKYILDYDCLIFDFKIIDKNINERKSINLSNGKISTKDAVALTNGSTWCKVYKSKIIKNKIEFPNIMRSEDLAFNKTAISKCKNIYYLNQSLYNYYINNDSIMHDSSTLDINNNKEALNYISKNVKGFKEEIEITYIREYLYLIVQIMIIQGKSRKEIISFIDEFNSSHNGWTKNEYIKLLPKHIQICLKIISRKKIGLLRIIFFNKKG